MSEKRYFIGVDLGGTNTKIVAINEEGEIFCQRKTPTESEKGPDATTDKIISLIEDLTQKKVLAEKSPRAVGIAVAGVVDMKEGICRFLTNFPTKWKNFPLVKKIEEATTYQAFLINDVRAMTLAEGTVGAGRGVKNFICIALGTGIGGGIVINGNLYFGSEGFAGEIGHQTVKLNGPLCGCGNYGCLEALASGPNITSQAIRFIKQGENTAIRELAGNDLNKISPEVIAEAARKQDPIAKKIWEREAYYLGTGIANLLVILNPEMIILGGGIARAADLFLGKIRKTLREKVHVGPDVDKLRIVKGKLQDIAGAVGAAIWAMKKANR